MNQEKVTDDLDVNAASVIQLRTTVPPRGVLARQWVWLLSRVEYPSTNISLEDSFGTGSQSSIFCYPLLGSAGVKRGILLAFLTHQMDSIRDLAHTIWKDECESKIPENDEDLLMAIRHVSRERPGRVPGFICNDMATVLGMKSLVSGSVEPDSDTLDALAMELSRRDLVHGVARWFAEKYLGMSQLEIHWRGWIFRTMILVFLSFILFESGRSHGSSETKTRMQREHCSHEASKTCSFCKKPSRSPPAGSVPDPR